MTPDPSDLRLPHSPEHRDCTDCARLRREWGHVSPAELARRREEFVVPATTDQTQSPTFLPMSRQERLDQWTEQARLCERDGRPDLVAICLEYAEALASPYGDRVDWERPA